MRELRSRPTRSTTIRREASRSGLILLPSAASDSQGVTRRCLGFDLLGVEQSLERIGFHRRAHVVATRSEAVEEQAPTRLVERVKVAHTSGECLCVSIAPDSDPLAGDRVGGVDEDAPKSTSFVFRPCLELVGPERREIHEEIAGVTSNDFLEVACMPRGHEEITITLDAGVER